MTNVYIQKDSEEFDFDFCYEAYQAFLDVNFWGREKVYNIINISYNDLSTKELSKSDIFVGSVDFMKAVFNKIGVFIPKPINIPKELSKFAGREISEGILENLKFPCFIKPLEELKLFTGFVIKSTKDLNLLYPEIKSDTKLLISEIVNFESEYRCFVYKGEWIDMKCYFGDFRKFPNVDIIQSAINSYSNSPIAYAIDFGVTDKGETKLIEVNDFYSCGTYGFFGETYIMMIRDRFREIVNKNKYNGNNN